MIATHSQAGAGMGNSGVRSGLIGATGKVTRYNLAYINHNICGLDNGRVVGYDNAHGHHHRHFKGAVEPIDFISFEDIEARFQRDWLALRDET